MAKTVDLKAAKAAKQKKIAIGGAVLLVLILALSVPRTLKMVSHKPPTAAAESQSDALPTPTITPSAPVTPTPASAAPVSQILSAPLEPAAHDGQLARLSPTFTSKDPFVQQMTLDGSADATSSDSSPAAADTTKKNKAQPPAHAPSPAVHATTRPAVVPPVSTPTTPPSHAPASPAAPTPPASRPASQPSLSATISVDGSPEGVNVKADFPAASPIFHLVSATRKTAVITIAGGSLANGDPTLTLHVGKAVTLMNTADGTRYKLVLVATSTAAAAPPAATPAGASGPAATTTTPSTTTATQTIGG